MPSNTSLSRPRVLVVADARVRSAIAAALRGEGYEVLTGSRGSTVADPPLGCYPDLALVSADLESGPDGYALTRKLRGASDLPVVLLLDTDAAEARRAVFAAGADDYLVKPVPTDELRWRVRALLRRAGHLAAHPVRRLGELRLDDRARTASRSGQPLALTPTEYVLLRALVEHPDQVLSKAELLAQVWNFEGYDPNVVEVHVSALRRKLDARGPRMLWTVRGAGYVLRADS